ncbi:hypothetical protein GGF44_002802, partial [Coemansia sp. RSA 1694]
SAPVRKRLSLACTTCRQRKVKCDGERPSCRTCAKFSWPCIYQPSNRKRGPRPRALALMDGSMPYSSRPHWTVSHSYYAYGYPSHSPLSPPPPPPQPQPHFAAAHHHHPDLPLNGAPMQVDPARHQPGSYNHDSYSTYGDFVANTGVIRIRPPPMRSPGFGQLSPASMHTNRDAQGHPHQHHHPYLSHGHSHSHSQSIGHSHTHQISAPASYDAQPTSPLLPLSAHDAPRYLGRPFCRPQSPFSPTPATIPSPYSRPLHGSAPDSHRYPPRHSPMLMSPNSAFDQVAALQDAPPSISSVAQSHPQFMGPAAAAAWPSETSARAPALEAPAMRSTPPQHMQQSAQSYSSAPPYALEMLPPKGPPSAGVAVAHPPPPAIYARGKADTPPTADRSSSSNNNSGFQTQPTPSEQSLLRRNGALPQSPRLAHDDVSSSVSYDFCRSEHMAQSDACGGEDRYASRHAPPERAMSTCTLPFSDGVARPRLPPLSELLGKDYQHAMPSSGMQTGADTQLGGGGSMSDRFVQPLSRRKDSFRDEVSKMLAHEGLH